MPRDALIFGGYNATAHWNRSIYSAKFDSAALNLVRRDAPYDSLLNFEG